MKASVIDKVTHVQTSPLQASLPPPQDSFSLLSPHQLFLTGRPGRAVRALHVPLHILPLPTLLATTRTAAASQEAPAKYMARQKVVIRYIRRINALLFNYM